MNEHHLEKEFAELDAELAQLMRRRTQLIILRFLLYAVVQIGFIVVVHSFIW